MAEKKRSFINKIKEDEKLKRSEKLLWEYRIEIFSGLLVLIGLILAFFYFRIAEGLVGLGFGICFFEEMHRYFVQLRDLYVEHGVFKSVMMVGIVIFFLIAIPFFIIASAVGYGAMYIMRWIVKK